MNLKGTHSFNLNAKTASGVDLDMVLSWEDISPLSNDIKSSIMLTISNPNTTIQGA